MLCEDGFDGAWTKINGGEAASLPDQHADRSNYFIYGHILLENGNFYGNIRDALGLVGLSTKSAAGYNTKIGFNIKTPQLQRIIGDSSHDLIAFSSDATPASGPSDSSQGHSIGENRESSEMFVLPPENIQTTLVTAAPNVTDAIASAEKITMLGICRFVTDDSIKEGAFPGYKMSVSSYLINALPKEFLGDLRQTTWGANWFTNTTIKVLQGPQHGELESSASGLVDLVYYPTRGYIGGDQVVLLATNTLPDGSPVRAKLIFFLNIIPSGKISFGGGKYVQSNTKYCPTGKETWTITTSPDGTAGDYSQPQRSFEFGSPSISVKYGDLPGFAVGEEDSFGGGASIILDTNAAGYGWFVDSTLDDNTEFLPTSNPNEWMAKFGTPAYGKMDLYTVLMHEYGHALGLEHSPNGNDFMATTLQPGVRRLLSEADLFAISQLAGLPEATLGSGLVSTHSKR